MTPIKFPQANAKFKAPPDLAESQCMTIHAYVWKINKGSLDGSVQTVVAWKPDEREIENIRNGAPVFLSVMGGLPPHYLTTNFEEATNPA